MIPDQQELEHAICGFSAEVLREPIAHFSEADLQVSLYAKLLPQCGGLYDTSLPRRPGSVEVYKTPLIHREYGRGQSKRMDIIIFSPDDVHRINSANLKVDDNNGVTPRYITPRFGIELGTEKGKGSHERAKISIESDLQKLAGIQERGYYLFFYRDTNSSEPHGGRGRAKESKIERDLCGPLKIAQQMDKIRVLAFLVRVPKSPNSVAGRSYVFDLQKGVWTDVDPTGAEAQILGHLT